jgi:hypothetical protein
MKTMALLVSALCLAACSSQRERVAADPTLNPDWSVVRVGGTPAAEVTERDGNFYAGPCSVTTPLPKGYPRPTPPDALELKRYPGIRRAEMRANGEGNVNAELGRNVAFFPLFNHIQKRDIAMTSPVEMDYPDLKVDDASTDKTRKWTMSFLYRTPELGPTGADGRVQVVDTAPVTVLSLGMKGRYSSNREVATLSTLGDWIKAHPQWRAAGPARALYYNGPDVAPANEWSELQVPIEKVTHP